LLAGLAGFAAFGVMGGCNLITGANDLHLMAGGAGGQGGASSGAGASGPSASAGSGSPSSGPGATSGTGGPTCSPACPALKYCEAATKSCVCDPGYVDMGGTCTAAPPGDPTTHTQQDVCAHWSSGHVLTESTPLVATGDACDAGMLTQAAIVDTLTRLNMFRWMVGLAPTSDDPKLDADAQKCANLEAWWPWTGGSPHQPPASSKCYTAEGGATAGESNIAWGSGNPAQAIDQFVQDNGNETTMGHRRWIVNPPLDPVGIGYWQTGGMYGNAECLRIFGASGTGPNPPWLAVPPPGFVPLDVATWTWTFHGSIGGVPNAQITMLRVDDNMPLAVTVTTLSQGYALDAISWTPSGWTVEAGKTYRVTVGGLAGGDVTYDVKPVMCN
jgi:hypothetical protein